MIQKNYTFEHRMVLQYFLSSLTHDVQEFYVASDIIENCGILVGTTGLSPEKLMFYQIIHIWYDILRNYSYSSTEHAYCKNGHVGNSIKSKYTKRYPSRFYLDNQYPQRSVVYLLLIQADHNPLRFLSCSKTAKLEPLAYRQLVNSYDNGMWIASGFLLLLLLPKLKAYLFGNFNKYITPLRMVQAVVALLMEKGDVLPQSITKIWSV